jgi:hypothetical protein
MLTNLGETQSGLIIFWDDETKEFVVIYKLNRTYERIRELNWKDSK